MAHDGLRTPDEAPREPHAGLRVAIVDDDSWVRRGRASAIDEAPGLDAVVVLSHDDALATTASTWADIDVALVDAHDQDAGFDKFIGVRVIGHIRSLTSRERPRIIVITGHTYNDLLRVRLAEAGADHLYAHTDVRSAEALVAAIVGAERDLSASARGRTNVNDAVTWAETYLGEAALQKESQKALPVSRRAIITARQRLRTQVPTPDGSVPSWKEIASFLDRARGKERRGDGRS